MPDVVRLRNNHGFPVEVDHAYRPDDDPDMFAVRGRLVTDMGEYRQLLGLKPDAPLGPDVDGYHWVLGWDPAVSQNVLRGWPRSTWDLVTDGPSTVDTQAAKATKARGK
jgi:hypothetical protein